MSPFSQLLVLSFVSSHRHLIGGLAFELKRPERSEDKRYSRGGPALTPPTWPNARRQRNFAPTQPATPQDIAAGCAPDRLTEVSPARESRTPPNSVGTAGRSNAHRLAHRLLPHDHTLQTLRPSLRRPLQLAVSRVAWHDHRASDVGPEADRRCGGLRWCCEHG